MDFDLMLVVGATLVALSIPSMLSAYADDRKPWVGAMVLLIACVLIAMVVTKKPGGLVINEVPNIFFTVIGRYIN
ncbi:hypothetical protein ACSBLW_11610 [Thioclava sp. FR2]|uniref:hypothetical protein n=1 Tax=Thioclava sp. FR2 TaxID=3445780 RepID=UPI003EB7AA8E